MNRAQNDPRPWSVRALLESTATPFTIASYRPRAAIYLKGGPCDSVMYIERGRVWLALTASNGKEAICGLLGTGAFLGEEALSGPGERLQSATAMTLTQVLVVPRPHMLRLLRTQPDLLDQFITHVLARNTRLEANLTDHLFGSGEQRLAHVLLALADCEEGRSGRCVLPDLTQEIIAEMVGTTRSRVSVLMSRFKRLGIIEENRGALFVNPARLRMVHRGVSGSPRGDAPRIG